MTRPFLIRAGTLITDPATLPGYLVDGGLRIDGDTIAEVAPFAALRTAHPDLPVEGGAQLVALPGLINAHDHGRGLSPLSLGIDDDLLEPWILNLSRMPPLDPGLDTQLSALRQLQSGISTTVNSYYHPGCDPAVLQAVRAAYETAGLRAALVLSAMDRPASQDLMRRAAEGGPPDLQRHVAQAQARRTPFDTDAWAALLRAAVAQDRTAPGLGWMMAGVISPHWSSDAQLTRVEALARDLALPTQMHLLESRLQARDNDRFSAGSMVRHLAGLGVLRPGASCAHGVQLAPDDMDVLAEAGAAVVHNPSSNLRLRSGIAPVPAMRDAGLTVALGLDSAGLNDTTDMFQEMRLAFRLHGTLTAREVLAMATVNGARALNRETTLGRLIPGAQADVLLLDPDAMPAPGLTAPDRIFDRLVLYGAPAAVQTLYVAGRRTIDRGVHPTLDEAQLLARLTQSLPQPPAPQDPVLQTLTRALRPLAQV